MLSVGNDPINHSGSVGVAFARAEDGTERLLHDPDSSPVASSVSSGRQQKRMSGTQQYRSITERDRWR